MIGITIFWWSRRMNRSGGRIVIFEAAFRFENLFIRTDILVKKGNEIRLIEVKAKSFDPDDDNLFIGKRGGLVGGWKPYLFDVAFQRYVSRNAIQNGRSDPS